jgi:hypothetical protein
MHDDRVGLRALRVLAFHHDSLRLGGRGGCGCGRLNDYDSITMGAAREEGARTNGENKSFWKHHGFHISGV